MARRHRESMMRGARRQENCANSQGRILARKTAGVITRGAETILLSVDEGRPNRFHLGVLRSVVRAVRLYRAMFGVCLSRGNRDVRRCAPGPRARNRYAPAGRSREAGAARVAR